MNTNDLKTHNDGDMDEAPRGVSGDRFERLFDLTSRKLQDDATEEALTLAEREEVNNIRSVLNVVDQVIDAGRVKPSTEANVDRIEERFFVLLGEEEHDHPWITSRKQNDPTDATTAEAPEIEVRTLGDLVRINVESAPPDIPRELMDYLFESGVPISDLLDVKQRPKRIGSVLKEAEAPIPTVMPIFRWMNESIKGVIPTTSRGVYIARRQRKSQRGG